MCQVSVQIDNLSSSHSEPNPRIYLITLLIIVCTQLVFVCGANREALTKSLAIHIAAQVNETYIAHI